VARIKAFITFVRGDSPRNAGAKVELRRECENRNDYLRPVSLKR
jgi:hypothetical protein